MMLEFHMLKNYPPVNLNRDDSGAPKSCFFGGVMRGRISSQCLKRSWRRSEVFKSLGSAGMRTRHMPSQVSDILRQRGIDEEYIAVSEKMLTGVANKEGKENAKGNFTAQIVMYAPEDLERLADKVQAAIAEDGDVKKFKQRKAKDFVKLFDDAKVRPITADIALFGRMVTSEAFRDVDASMQVAHAISTHAVNRESDYYTAVDDLLDSRDENGAGMMGDTDYNSCCYYEYASLDLDQLRENLQFSENRDELIKRLIPALMRAMAFTNPSGKQNTFAGQVLPSLMLVECKKDKIPLSYVNAYEEPVATYGARPQVVQNSIRKLFEEIGTMDEVYQLNVEHRAWLTTKKDMPAQLKRGEQVQGFDALCDAVMGWVEEEQP
ncbi:MAG: type I-E CRISPR-associated protein Cas7/Cse4/CasC [Clostridia bacterium]|nr:type I-E CRISPR-associated protein Cas7/Cse4/CasC [Clostridia bacterium]